MIKNIKVLMFILVSITLIPTYVSAYAPVSCRVHNQIVYINTPTSFDRIKPQVWNSIGNFLVTTKFKVYILNWQGYGGDVDTGKQFIDFMIRARNQGKIIIINMIGNAYSMHSNATCYANQVKYNNFFLMFHADASERTHKRTIQKHSNINNMLNQCQRARIVDQQEITKLWEGYEVYIKSTTHWYLKDPRPLE